MCASSHVFLSPDRTNITFPDLSPERTDSSPVFTIVIRQTVVTIVDNCELFRQRLN